MKRNPAILLALLLWPAVAAAQQIDISNTRYGGTAAQFLTLPADARGAALGGSYAALVSDVTSMFWNPAGLALMPTKEAMFSYTPYVADTHHLWLGVGWPLRGGEWAIGLSLANFGFGDQPVYTENFMEGTGETYGVSETAISLTGSMQVTDRFSAGLTGKLINLQLANTSANGVAVDFGTSFHTEVGNRPIRASFAVLNLGLPLQAQGPELNTSVDPVSGGMGVDPQPAQFRTSEADPPTQFRVGLSYDALAQGDRRLTLLSEFWQPNDSDPGLGLGAEYALRVAGDLRAALRGSYSLQADNSNRDVSSEFSRNVFASTLADKARWDGLAFGGGLAWSSDLFNVGLDYTYRHLGMLPGVSMFSLKVGW